jgi:hypothetical protein
MNSILNLITWIIYVINAYLVPLIFAAAFILFLFGVFRYFFVGAADAKKREEGRKFIVGGIVAFAVMLSVWGLVNIIRGSLPLGSNNQPALPTFSNTSASPGAQSGSNPGAVSGNGGSPGAQSDTQTTGYKVPSGEGFKFTNEGAGAGITAPKDQPAQSTPIPSGQNFSF